MLVLDWAVQQLTLEIIPRVGYREFLVTVMQEIMV